MRGLRIVGLIAISVIATSCSSRSVAPLTAQVGGNAARPQVLQGGGFPRNFTRFSPTTYSGNYGGIVVGPDENMWFVDTGGPGLVKMTMTGATTEYPLPSRDLWDLDPIAISPAPNSHFFILACNTDPNSQGEGAIEYVNMTGKGSVFRLSPPDVAARCHPNSMVTGPDGNAWYDQGGDFERISPSGIITQYQYAGGGDTAITAGPNGDLWAADGINNGIVNTVAAYDPATNAWTTKAPMPTARAELAAGVVNGVLYAAGGEDSNRNTVNTVEAFSPK